MQDKLQDSHQQDGLTSIYNILKTQTILHQKTKSKLPMANGSSLFSQGPQPRMFTLQSLAQVLECALTLQEYSSQSKWANLETLSSLKMPTTTLN